MKLKMQKNPAKKTGLKISLMVHAIALLLIMTPVLYRLLVPRKDVPERISYVEIIPAGAPAPTIPLVAMPTPVQAPAVEEIAVAAEPALEKEAPKATPVKSSKPVQRQTNKVIRTDTAMPHVPTTPPPPSAEEVKRMLTDGVSWTAPAGPLSADSDPALGAYYEKVFRQMYAAWNQPESLRLLPGLKTEILITVTRDGKITGRKMRFGSGNQLMDASVMDAVNSVRELPPLPMEYRKPQEIIVTFVLGN